MKHVNRPYYVYLKLDLLYLAESGEGLVDKTDEYYVPICWMDGPYDFSKDLPQDVRVYFLGSKVELPEDQDSCILTVKLPHRKPIKLSPLAEDEYPDKVFIEFIKNKLSLRLTFVSRFTEVFDTLKITKGKEKVVVTHEDFASGNKDFRYPNSGQAIPWLEGFQVVEFDDEKILIVNPKKNINIQLDGENQKCQIEDIRFDLSYSSVKIIDMEPVSQKLWFFKVDAKLFDRSFVSKCAAYKLACSLEEQEPKALNIVHMYMLDAVALDSRQAEQWINELHKKRFKNPLKPLK